MMHWFDYSILKYSPNPKRGEVVNIGIVVYRTAGADVRLLKNPSKIKMLDKGTSIEDIYAFEEGLSQICKLADGVEDQFNLLKNFSGGVFVSSKSSFSISDIGQYESRVNFLFNELIKPYASRSVANHSRLHTRLKQKFKEMDILASDEGDIYNHKIVPSYPLGSSSGLTADFMLKNGKFHMTGVIDFNVNDTQAKFKETTLKVMSFVEARKNIAEDVGRYLVFSASATKETEISQHLRLAADYSDEMFNLESDQDSNRYFEMLGRLVAVPRLPV